MEAHDGRTRLHGAGSRPLVVAFANPKKIRPGEPPEPAIAPRKLFVGQVSPSALAIIRVHTERGMRHAFHKCLRCIWVSSLTDRM